MRVIASSRPLGMAGVSGGGTVCVLTLKAKAGGDVSITLVRAAAKNSAQQSTEIAGSQAWVHISQEIPPQPPSPQPPPRSSVTVPFLK
jgi:hypothetical protein